MSRVKHVTLKMARAGEHLDQLGREVSAFYNASLGGFSRRSGGGDQGHEPFSHARRQGFPAATWLRAVCIWTRRRAQP